MSTNLEQIATAVARLENDDAASANEGRARG